MVNMFDRLAESIINYPKVPSLRKQEFINILFATACGIWQFDTKIQISSKKEDKYIEILLQFTIQIRVIFGQFYFSPTKKVMLLFIPKTLTLHRTLKYWICTVVNV